MRDRRRSERHGGLGLIDIGSTKIACLIAEPAPTHRDPRSAAGTALPRVLGLGLQRSRGVKAGVIVDLDEAEHAVRAAVGQAERMAQTTLEEVHVSVACGRLKSLNFAANADVEGGSIATADIARLMNGARAYAERDGRTVVHMNRLGWRIDGLHEARDPRGMTGKRLSAQLHVVTADEAPLRNLMLLIERCYLGVAGLTAAPFASAMAATNADERRLGCACLDIGGGTTSIALFHEGRIIHAEVVPVGGGHITTDIARTLQTPLAQAERIKTLYGTLLSAPSDAHELFSYPLAGEEEGSVARSTKAQLTGIVRPRVEGLLALVQERLEKAGLAGYVGERVVLTGGTAQLIGIAELVANCWGRPVRVARAPSIPNLPQSIAGPAFSTLAGLFVTAAHGGEGTLAFRDEHAAPGGYLGQVGRWFRQGFE